MINLIPPGEIITKRSLWPRKGREYTATYRTVTSDGVHGLESYGSTEYEAEMNLRAELAELQDAPTPGQIVAGVNQ